MQRMIRWRRGFLGIALLSLCAGLFPVGAQDLVAVNDITGGSSVFVFRNSSRTAAKKFTTRAKPQRTAVQRLETAKKVSKQYVTLAKVNPKRARSVTVDPNKVNVPTASGTMPADQASKLFAGVGEYYIDQNDLDNSLKFFRESVSLDIKNKNAQTGLSEALALKGNDLLVTGKPENAKAYFQESLGINPNNSAALFGLGEVFAELDKDSEAIASYEKALLVNKDLTEIYVPLGILYYQKGDIAKADELLSKALVNSADNAETQYFLGLVRFAQQNRDAEALAGFRKATELDPAYGEAYYYTGETLVRLGKQSDAVEEYKKAIAAKPNYVEAMLALGAAYYELEKYTDAVDIYKQALKLKNDSIEAYVNLGDTYRQMKLYNEAEASYNQAATLIGRAKDFPKDEAAEVFSKHGYVIGLQCEINKVKALPCKWPTALRSLEAAVAITQSAADYSNLGWAYYKAGRVDLDFNRVAEGKLKLEQAKVNLEKVIAMNPSYVEGALMNLGLTLSDLGNYQGAIPMFERVIDKKPNWVFAINELGLAYLGLKNYKDAAKQFRKAVDKDDNYFWGYYNLAQTEFEAGNKGEAKKAYEKLKKLNPALAARLYAGTRGEIGK